MLLCCTLKNFRKATRKSLLTLFLFKHKYAMNVWKECEQKEYRKLTGRVILCVLQSNMINSYLN